MKIKLCLIIIFFSLIKTCVSYASTQTDQLWFEYTDPLKEKNGTATLSLRINYGKFPNKKEEIKVLDNLSAFYALAGENEQNNLMFREIPVQKDKEGYFIKISSPGINRFIVTAKAEENHDKTACKYLAKTAFILFGSSLSEEKESAAPAETTYKHQVDSSLEIITVPEFNYWPQTGEPVEIIPLYNKNILAGKILRVLDENKNPMEIRTDENGSAMYIPPHDRALNKKGETSFKHSVITVEAARDNIKHISTYTLLLHRSRFKNRNFLAGISIFTATLIGAVLTITLKRKKGSLDTL